MVRSFSFVVKRKKRMEDVGGHEKEKKDEQARSNSRLVVFLGERKSPWPFSCPLNGGACDRGGTRELLYTVRLAIRLLCVYCSQEQVACPKERGEAGVFCCMGLISVRRWRSLDF